MRAWKKPGKMTYLGMEGEWARLRILRVLTGFCQQREPHGRERKLRTQGLKITGMGKAFLAILSAVQRDLRVKLR